jgi:hypothetical protein
MIEQVASATKISVRLLHLLEEDQYAELPAKPFIRGFVISYCRFVGVDHRELLVRFDKFIVTKVNERPARDTGHSGYAFERREGDQSRTMLWLVMGFFVLIGGLTMIVLKPNLKRHKHSAADKLRESNVEVVEVSSSPNSTSSFSSSTSSTSPSSSSVSGMALASSSLSSEQSSSAVVIQQVSSLSSAGSVGDPLNSGSGLDPKLVRYKVVLRAQEDLRVRYRVDSRADMEIIVRKGRLLVLRAERTVRLQVSEGTAAVYSLNNSPDKPLNAAPGYTEYSGNPTLSFSQDPTEIKAAPFPQSGKLLPPPPSPRREATSSSSPE